MKQNFIVIFMVMCFLAGGLFAQSNVRTVVTLGGSWWGGGYSYEDEDGNKIADIGNGNSFGPYISINHGKINFGASLLLGGFPVDAFLAYLGEDSGFDHLENYSEDEINLNRSDLNFSLGYRIHPNINLFLGGKYIKWDVESDLGSDFENIYGIDGYEESKGGMMYGVGIALVLPIGSEGLYAFGSLAGMGGTLDHESIFTYDDGTDDYELDDSEISATLAAINLGLGYRFPSGFGINVGYRMDMYSEDLEVEYWDDDLNKYVAIKNPDTSVQGMIITASYSF